MYRNYFSQYYNVKPTYNKKPQMSSSNLQKNNLFHATNFHSFSNTNSSDLSRHNNLQGAIKLLQHRQPKPAVLPISVYTSQN